MFGLIGHSTSFEAARAKARTLGFEEFAEGDLDVWCSAPPQLVEHLQVTSATGKTIEGAYIDSCFVPEMLSRFKTARRKVLSAMELAQKNGIDITALGGFTSIIFENFNLLKEQQIRSTTLDWERFTTGNTHTAWVICRQVETNAPRLGIDLAQARVAVVGQVVHLHAVAYLAACLVAMSLAYVPQEVHRREKWVALQRAAWGEHLK